MKSKLLYIVFGLIFFTAVILGVSLRVSQRSSIAPTAPLSKPLAGALPECNDIGYNLDCFSGSLTSISGAANCMTGSGQNATCCLPGKSFVLSSAALKCVSSSEIPICGNGMTCSATYLDGTNKCKDTAHSTHGWWCKGGSGGGSGGGSSGSGGSNGSSSGGGGGGSTSNNTGGSCQEECPGDDGVLRNCTGAQEQSLCSWQGRVESCGGDKYCCPSAGGNWTKDMKMCKKCNVKAPTNLSTESISGTSQKLKWKNGKGGMVRISVSKHHNPTQNCDGSTGNKDLCVLNDERIKNGAEEFTLTGLKPNTTYYWRMMTWKESGCDSGTSVYSFKTANQTCTDTTWTPDPALTCTGTNLTQTSNCGTTRTVAGTRNCSCTPSGVITCNPDCPTTCGQAATTISSCTDSCGSPTTKQCPATGNCCSDTVWLPNANLTCTEASVTQTSNCGTTRTVSGTKNCCIESSWGPVTTSTCSDREMTQTSNCGTTRTVNGTKTCYPELSIETMTYADDPRNTEGVYYTDKAITKVSRGQVMLYAVEVKNSGEGGAKNVVITDSLIDQNQNLLTFVDSESKCEYNFTAKKLTCKIDSIPYKGAEKIKFRVRVAQTALNGKIIRNTARVSYSSKTRDASVNTLVSSIVACNEACTNDSECVGGLACDVISGKCRKPSCISSTSCGCTTPTLSESPTMTIEMPDTTADDATLTATKTPTQRLLAEIDAGPDEEEIVDDLPKSGIFDLSQGTILGSGIILAIIGLFLAL